MPDVHYLYRLTVGNLDPVLQCLVEALPTHIFADAVPFAHARGLSFYSHGERFLGSIVIVDQTVCCRCGLDRYQELRLDDPELVSKLNAWFLVTSQAEVARLALARRERKRLYDS